MKEDMKMRIVDFMSGMIFGYGFGMVAGYYIL